MVVGTRGFLVVEWVVVLGVGGVVVVGWGGHGQSEISGVVGPLTQPSQLNNTVTVITPSLTVPRYELAEVPAVVQHVAGGLEVSEPVTAGLLPAPHLTGPGRVGEPVLGQDVVLRQLAGSHLSWTAVTGLSSPGRHCLT